MDKLYESKNKITMLIKCFIMKLVKQVQIPTKAVCVQFTLI